LIVVVESETVTRSCNNSDGGRRLHNILLPHRLLWSDFCQQEHSQFGTQNLNSRKIMIFVNLQQLQYASVVLLAASLQLAGSIITFMRNRDSPDWDQRLQEEMRKFFLLYPVHPNEMSYESVAAKSFWDATQKQVLYLINLTNYFY